MAILGQQGSRKKAKAESPEAKKYEYKNYKPKQLLQIVQELNADFHIT